MKQDVLLPGGIEIDGARHREAVFRPITGYVERQINEIHQNAPGASTRVTDTLAACLESLGGKQADRTLVENLCIADRQFLMLCLSVRLKGRQQWFHPTCDACGARFDLAIDKLLLPVVPAGGNYPHTTVYLDGRNFSLRIPTGRDQAGFEHLDEDLALRHVLRSCIEEIDGEVPDEEIVGALKDPDIEKIESALDEVSPSVCTRVETECPECNERQSINLDLNALGEGLSGDDLMTDIHRIAGHYHWSEHEILSLPKARRHAYIKLIDASEGQYS